MLNIVIGKSGFLTQALISHQPTYFNSSHCLSLNSSTLDSISSLISSHAYHDEPINILFAAWPTTIPYDDPQHIEFFLSTAKPFLSDLCELFPSVRLFTFGTCLEYGLREGPLSIKNLCYPCTKLGASKLMLYDFCTDLPFASHTHLRIFYPYDFASPRPNSLIWHLKQAIDSSHDEFSMSSGQQSRDFFSTQSFAIQVHNLILSPRPTPLVNVGSFKSTTVLSLVQQYCRFRNSSISLNPSALSIPWYEPFHFFAS